MTDTLAEKLRQITADDNDEADVLFDAADLIEEMQDENERLRAEVERLREVLREISRVPLWDEYRCIEIARAALEEKK